MYRVSLLKIICNQDRLLYNRNSTICHFMSIKSFQKISCLKSLKIYTKPITGGKKPLTAGKKPLTAGFREIKV